MFENVIWLSESWGTGFRCEDLILLHLLWNDKNVNINPTDNSKYRKNVAIDKKCIL